MASTTSKNHRVFGQATRGRGGGPTRYQRQQGQNQKQALDQGPTEEQELAQRRLAARLKRREQDAALDKTFGVSTFDRTSSEAKKRGWIYNILPTVRFGTVVVPSRGVPLHHLLTCCFSL